MYKKIIHEGKIGIESQEFTCLGSPSLQQFVDIVRDQLTLNTISVTFSSITLPKSDITKDKLSSVSRISFIVTISHISGKCTVNSRYYETMSIGANRSTPCYCLQRCMAILADVTILPKQNDVKSLERLFHIKVDIHQDERSITYSQRNRILKDEDILIHGNGKSRHKILYKDNHYDIITKRYSAKECQFDDNYIDRYRRHVNVYYFFHRKIIFDTFLTITKTDQYFKPIHTQTLTDPMTYLSKESQKEKNKTLYLIGWMHDHFLFKTASQHGIPIQSVTFDKGRVTSAMIGSFRMRQPFFLNDTQITDSINLSEMYHKQYNKYDHIDIDQISSLSDFSWTLFECDIPKVSYPLSFVRQAYIESNPRDIQHPFPIGEYKETNFYRPGKLGIYRVGKRVLTSIDIEREQPKKISNGIYWEETYIPKPHAFTKVLIERITNAMSSTSNITMLCQNVLDIEKFMSITKDTKRTLIRITDNIYIAEGYINNTISELTIYAVFLHAYGRYEHTF
jgi:hypothetical protein